jgi:hypothetical protein
MMGTYEGTNINTWTKEEITEPVHVRKGVKQRCSLSHIFFIWELTSQSDNSEKEIHILVPNIT